MGFGTLVNPIYIQPPQPDVTHLMAPYTPVGQRERVQKFMASCRVQVKLLEKKVSPGEQTWCTPNISFPLRLEVSSYTGQRRLLQRVALVNW